MSTSQDTIHYICDQAGFGSRLTYKRMFGEYALYLDGKVVAFVCEDQLFLTPTSEGQRYLGQVVPAPPYPGAKDYFLIAAELDDPERVHTALEITAQALPEQKPKGKARPPKKRDAEAQSQGKAKEIPKAKAKGKGKGIIKVELKAKRGASK
jgi:TfoX/Sxy family transcriptional regulator of competence genes